jgi:hypothetical protein
MPYRRLRRGKGDCAGEDRTELEAIERDRPTRLASFAQWQARIAATRAIAELLIVEAKAAADYWRAFADKGLREAKGGNLPRTWLRFANRQKGAGFLGSKSLSANITFECIAFAA